MINKRLNIVKNNFEELPNNIQAEQSVIGTILVSNEIFDEINTIISSNNFFDPMHQKIFSAIENLIYKGMLANPITLKNYFENEKDDINVPDYLVKVTKFSTSSRQAIGKLPDAFSILSLPKSKAQTVESDSTQSIKATNNSIISKSFPLHIVLSFA